MGLLPPLPPLRNRTQGARFQCNAINIHASQKILRQMAGHVWGTIARTGPNMTTFQLRFRKPKVRRRKRGARIRCDADIKNPVVFKKGFRRARGPKCRNWAMPNGRCRLHGGLSTGPKTEAGRARSLAALQAGRRNWLTRRTSSEDPLS